MDFVRCVAAVFEERVLERVNLCVRACFDMDANVCVRLPHREHLKTGIYLKVSLSGQTCRMK